MGRLITLSEIDPVDLGNFDGVKAVFLSDIHLTEEVDSLSDAVSDFIRTTDATHLFLLGDIFDFWLGDQHSLAPSHKQILKALKCFSERGCELIALRGNRDFLLPDYLSRHLHVRTPGNAALVRAGERKILITHGDLVCTWDSRYGAWRRLCSSGSFAGIARVIPLSLGKIAGRMARIGSSVEVSFKPNCSIDRFYHALELVYAGGIDTVVAGHIHDVGSRTGMVDGRQCDLYILGGNYRGSSYLQIDDGSLSIEKLT